MEVELLWDSLLVQHPAAVLRSARHALGSSFAGWLQDDFCISLGELHTGSYGHVAFSWSCWLS